MSDTCDKKLGDAYKGKLTDKDIEAITEQVRGIVAKAEKEGKDPAKALKEATEAYVVKIKTDKVRTATTEAIVSERMDYMNSTEAFKNNPKLAMESMLVADTSGKFKGVGNVESKKGAIVNDFASAIERKFNSIDGGLDRMLSGTDDTIIMAIRRGEKVNATPDQKLMAQYIQEIEDSLFQRKADAGLTVGYKEGRTGKQFYKRQEMLDFDNGSGGRKWRAKFREHVDFEAMGMTDQAEIEGFLKKMWDGRTATPKGFFEVSDDFTSIRANITQNRMEAKSSVIFKSAQDRVAYNSDVNKMTIYDALVTEIGHDAGDIAAATLFGPNYRAGFNKLLTHAKGLAEQIEKPDGFKLADVKNPKKLAEKAKAKLNYKPLGATQEQNLKNYLQYAVRPGRKPADNLWAKFGEKSRKLVDMARLDKALFTTLTDFAYGSGVVNATTGKNILHSNVDLIRDFSKMIKPSNRKQFASKMGVFMDDLISQQNVRGLGEEGSKSSWFDKAHNMYMKFSGLQQQSMMMRTAVAKQVTTIFEGEKGKAFGDLYEGSIETMQKFGIGEKEWDVIRKSSGDFGDGTKGLLSENIKDVAISDKWSGYLSWAAENGSPTAGVRRTAWKGAVDPNTFGGQMMLFMGQYKSFTLSMFDTMGMLSRTGTNATGKMARVGAVAGLSTVYGGMALTLKHIAKGKDLDDLDLDSPEFFMDSAIQGGAGMIFMDFMANDYNKSYKSLAKDAAGPAFGIADDFAGLMSKAVRGDAKAKDVMRTLERNSPTIPIIGHILRKKTFEGLNRVLNTD